MTMTMQAFLKQPGSTVGLVSGMGQQEEIGRIGEQDRSSRSTHCAKGAVCHAREGGGGPS